MTASEIAALISRIVQGDTQAENVLFQFLDPVIRKMVISRLFKKVMWEEQMDILAETQKGLLLSLRKNGYDPSKQKLEKYIGGIIDNNIKQHYRKKYSNREFPDDNELAADIASPDRSALEDMLTDEQYECIKKKINAQKPIHKKILLLSFIEGKSVNEISALLEMRPKKVTDLKHYALKKLVSECQNDSYFSMLSILMQILL